MRGSVFATTVVGLLALGCGGRGSPATPTDRESPPIIQPGLGPGLQALVSALRTRGATVAVGPPGYPYALSVPWRPLDVNRERARVQVFEYPNRNALELDAATISPDGFRIGLARLDWIAYPHFFKSSRLIVNYVGCNTETISLLETIVGPRFAGGPVGPLWGMPCEP